MHTNLENIINLINQIVVHLDRISDSEYSEKLKILGNASIGEHIRHIYNFPECLLRGIQTGTVNYDKRIRDTKLETDREYAIKSLLNISEKIFGISHFIEKTLLLESGLTENNSKTMETNLKRELHYITEHTIHHMAILRIGMSFHFPYLEIEDSFGFSYSTIEYKNFLNTI